MTDERGHTDLSYEATDARTGAVFKFAAVLAVAIVLSAGAALGLLKYLQKVEERQDPPPPPMGVREPGHLPPEPRLQTNPFQDLEKVREEERLVLTTHGWIDAKAGIVRIPIEDAMKRLAERGLPPATAPAPVIASARAPAPQPSPSARSRP